MGYILIIIVIVVFIISAFSIDKILENTIAIQIKEKNEEFINNFWEKYYKKDKASIRKDLLRAYSKIDNELTGSIKDKKLTLDDLNKMQTLAVVLIESNKSVMTIASIGITLLAAFLGTIIAASFQGSETKPFDHQVNGVIIWVVYIIAVMVFFIRALNKNKAKIERATLIQQLVEEKIKTYHLNQKHVVDKKL
ncbi:hypothetical protein [Aneurinibacillus migulanus]|uniref:Uncharacterized protein n=1 Tax=Aneurinibacillus migulanus TaxID=47500 RepID=A0A0D1UT04_ANEMI|nr:hypothetical protein [Aneurinibacillus migulanus]KIV50059.1 hypothetical protein TS65_29820 [Aneurinibacillus migulanus]KON95218.1 hypothetical protein AF333_06740 [Aneurinibacillus migulanus]MED0895714.1 hypothetical protein [Aneurinibacillus migulanus]MED1619775.1 hypothetical protein [Aneurinibacillus migulanus]SDK32503.1 hypothetical protein SAMN04487909_1497 [Aneurinibacillus migulanus]